MPAKHMHKLIHRLAYPMLFNIFFINLLAESIFFGFLIKVFFALPLILPCYDCYADLQGQLQ